MTDDDRPFTVETAAEYLECSQKHIRWLCRTGRLAHFRLGGRLIRIPQSAMRELQQEARKQRSDQKVVKPSKDWRPPRPVE